MFYIWCFCLTRSYILLSLYRLLILLLNLYYYWKLPSSWAPQLSCYSVTEGRREEGGGGRNSKSISGTLSIKTKEGLKGNVLAVFAELVATV